MNQNLKEITIFTDGACRGNPGPGGYGIVMIYKDPSGIEHKKELSGGYRLTTNNRMELLAAIVSLEALKEPCRVTLYSDSSYLVNAHIQHWIDGWIQNQWVHKTSHGKEAVKNKDLWLRLLKAESLHQIEYIWVKGHAENAMNNRCDELATASADDTDHYISEEFLEGGI